MTQAIMVYKTSPSPIKIFQALLVLIASGTIISLKYTHGSRQADQYYYCFPLSTVDDIQSLPLVDEEYGTILNEKVKKGHSKSMEV